MEVRLKEIGPVQVAIVNHVGSYRDTPSLFEQTVKWLRQRQLRIVGPPFGWFYDDPEKVPEDKLRSEVGFPFAGEADSEGDIQIRQIPQQEVLSTTHKGPYREVGPSYRALFEYAEEKGYVPQGCPIEIYLNDPAKVSESDLLTEIQVPVKKK